MGGGKIEHLINYHAAIIKIGCKGTKKISYTQYARAFFYVLSIEETYCLFSGKAQKKSTPARECRFFCRLSAFSIQHSAFSDG